MNPDDICAKPEPVEVSTRPSTFPIYPAAVYECESTAQADRLLGGEESGYVYQRDGHPNATVLEQQCRQLHGGDELGVGFAKVTSTGMSAMALALVSVLKTGDHVVISDQLYGRTTRLIDEELSRFGVSHTEVKMTDLGSVKAAIGNGTKLLILETIANPLLEVADLDAISSLCKEANVLVLVDNTFATPMLTRPFEHGADFVLESMSKILNGHGDLMLGLLCGRAEHSERIRNASSSWGVTASPFDCWLAMRGLSTAHLRIDRASANAIELASNLENHPAVSKVFYPGLKSHATAENAKRILGDNGGTMLTIELAGGKKALDHLIESSKRIKFCPSLGEIATTVSHPRSTSHRGLSAAAAEELGIREGMLRISCGVESFEFLRNEFDRLLAQLDE